MDIEAEIRSLKRRVGDLEGAVNVLTGKMRDVQPALEALREDSGRWFDTAGRQVTQIVQRLDTMNSQVWSLRDDLPVLLDEALVRANLRPVTRGDNSDAYD